MRPGRPPVQKRRGVQDDEARVRAGRVIAAHLGRHNLALADLHAGKKGRNPEAHKRIVAVCAAIALELFESGLCCEQIAEALDKNHTTVSLWLRQARQQRRRTG